MKRAIVASILGMAASVAMVSTTHAQGTIFFCNYTGGGLTAPVTFTGPAVGGFTAGETIGSGFTANLLYSLNGTTFTDSGITTGFLAPSGTAPSAGGGLFGTIGNQVTIPGYASGNCWFQIEVYNGSSYAASTISGISGVFETSVLATAGNALPTGNFFDARMVVPLSQTGFTVAQAVPEPMTMALGGLGLASLLLFRRKQV